MKFFKKPLVAVILSCIMVWCATLLSFEFRFQDKCQEVINGFYDGVYFNGELQPSCSSRLRTIVASADKIKFIADSEGLETEELASQLQIIKNGFRYSSSNISYLYCCYSDLMEELKAVRIRLNSADISEENNEKLNELYSTLETESAGFETSGYNESVREFLNEYEKFPVTYFYWHSNVRYPDYFA